jgi:ABC-2 type transport system permease protein
MPVTPSEIMLAKVWSMGAVVLLAAGLSLVLIVQGLLHVPIEGSVSLFLVGTALHLFATTSLGIFMATQANSMPQFGILAVLVMMALQLLSGNATPRESMPDFIQTLMLIAPTTHFVAIGQAILFRGAGFAVVWPSFVELLLIGGTFLFIALNRFRRSVSQMV